MTVYGVSVLGSVSSDSSAHTSSGDSSASCVLQLCLDLLDTYARLQSVSGLVACVFCPDVHGLAVVLACVLRHCGRSVLGCFAITYCLLAAKFSHICSGRRILYALCGVAKSH